MKDDIEPAKMPNPPKAGSWMPSSGLRPPPTRRIRFGGEGFGSCVREESSNGLMPRDGKSPCPPRRRGNAAAARPTALRPLPLSTGTFSAHTGPDWTWGGRSAGGLLLAGGARGGCPGGCVRVCCQLCKPGVRLGAVGEVGRAGLPTGGGHAFLEAAHKAAVWVGYSPTGGVRSMHPGQAPAGSPLPLNRGACSRRPLCIWAARAGVCRPRSGGFGFGPPGCGGPPLAHCQVGARPRPTGVRVTSSPRAHLECGHRAGRQGGRGAGGPVVDNVAPGWRGRLHQVL